MGLLSDYLYLIQSSHSLFTIMFTMSECLIVSILKSDRIPISVKMSAVSQRSNQTIQKAIL